MMFEFKTEVLTKVYVDDDTGTAEITNEIACTVPLAVQAKNDIGSLVCAHIIDEMTGTLDGEQ